VEFFGTLLESRCEAFESIFPGIYSTCPQLGLNSPAIHVQPWLSITARNSIKLPEFLIDFSLSASIRPDVHFGLSVFGNVFFLSKSGENPLVRQNCAVTLQEKKIEIWRVSMFW
jgi:hypothetical protein